MAFLLRKFQFWLILCLIGTFGCSGDRTSASVAPVTSGGAETTARKAQIVTTVGMLTDIVREVVGDRGEVIGLLSEGVDPHLYKPTREDVKRLTEADVIFYGGLMLEGRMEDSLATEIRQAGRGRRRIARSDGSAEASRIRRPLRSARLDGCQTLEPVRRHGHQDDA